MPESSLSLSFTALSGEVGLFLGWGRGAANGDKAWTAQQQASINSAVASGIRQFYFPPPIDGSTASYDWSFMKPVATKVLHSGKNTLPLSDDFAGIEGRITVSSGSQSGFASVDITGEGRIREMFAATPLQTGRPWCAAIQPLKGTGPASSNRFQLYVFPTPDQDYTLQFAYYLLPDMLSGTQPFTYGGMQHAETLKESCLACAEQMLDDAMSVHTAKFKERLAASISMDKRSKPQLLGYNGDRSDCKDGFNRRDLYYEREGGVRLNGTQY